MNPNDIYIHEYITINNQIKLTVLYDITSRPNKRR